MCIQQCLQFQKIIYFQPCWASLLGENFNINQEQKNLAVQKIFLL